MRSRSPFLCAVGALACLAPVVAAAGPASAQSSPSNLLKFVQVGKSLYPAAATAASGRWLERAALNPATYGKVRGVSPVVSPEPKVVLYTASLDEEFFRVAAAVDRYVGQNPRLAWSLVQVQDVRGPDDGPVTVEAMRTRLEEVRALARRHRIRNLSFVVSPLRSDTKVTPDRAVVVAYVRPQDGAPFPVVTWLTAVDAGVLQSRALTGTIAALDGAVQADQGR
jgi:hypothetical protein